MVACETGREKALEEAVRDGFKGGVGEELWDGV